MTRRLLVVTSGLDQGGAETFLARLAPALQRRGFVVSVVSLRSGGPIARCLREASIDVVELGLPTINALAGAPIAMIRACIRARPATVLGWMYHGNLAAALAARCGRGVGLVWSVRQSRDSHATDSTSTRVAVRVSRLVSRLPDCILYNSEHARRTHEAFGFSAARSTVIPNGFMSSAAAPDAAAARAALGLPAEGRILTHIARWHPVKDHATMIRAFGRIAAARSDVHFVFAGAGLQAGNADLRTLLDAAGISPRTFLLGARQDIEAILATSHIVCLSSRSEAMPNVIGEAMAAHRPCISTDVGDVASLIGETGHIVPIGDDKALASAALDLLALPLPQYQALGAAASARIAERFSLDVAADRYAQLLRAPARSS